MIAFVLSVMACSIRSGVQIQRVFNAINEHWLGFKVGHDLCGCRKGHGRNKDFISFTYPGSFKSQMEGSRARIHRDSMFSPHHGGKFPFEIPRLWSGRQPTRPQNIEDFCNLFLPYIRYMEWEHSLIH